MKLRDLTVDVKTVEVPFDGHETFLVELSYVSRTEMGKIVKDCQKSVMSRATKRVEMELDQEKFLKRFVERVVKGWKGLTPAILSEFVAVEEFSEEVAGKEIEFELEAAIYLVKESQMFDDWINEKVNDIDTFRS